MRQQEDYQPFPLMPGITLLKPLVTIGNGFLNLKWTEKNVIIFL